MHSTQRPVFSVDGSTTLEEIEAMATRCGVDPCVILSEALGR